MAVAGLPVGAETSESEAKDAGTQIGLMGLGQDEDTAVIGDQAQTSVPLSTGPADPVVAVLEVLCRSAGNQDCEPATGKIDRGGEHPLADGFAPAEIVVLLEEGLEAAMI